MEKDLRDRRLKQFETYRAEDKHECSLLSSRLTALLTSQSFLAVAAASVYAKLNPPENTRIVTGIAILAFLLAVVTSLAICIGCNVLRRWHEFGGALLKQDEDRDQRRILRGFHTKRRQVDLRHWLSMDWLHAFMPFAFGTAWSVLVGFLHGWLSWPPRNSWRYGLFAIAILFAWLLLMTWILFHKWKEQLKPEDFQL